MTADIGGSDQDRQITALTEIVGALSTTVSQLNTRVDKLTTAVDKLTTAKRSRGQRDSADGQDEEQANDPAAWVWFTPPAAAEDDPDAKTDDPRITVDNFVTWYNITYVGIDGTRAKPIPDCWRHHPGLAMEIATLAYSWRTANIGPQAAPREAQYWHHQWRPGFTDRLTREWTHTDCTDGDHRAAGPGERPDRFTLAAQEPAEVGESSRTGTLDRAAAERVGHDATADPQQTLVTPSYSPDRG
ncbi:MAG: hypothetical protein ACRDQU_03130 [Pseudonocardiaceae bacterium]